MSRAFDNWSPIYDASNKPLYGRLTFYKLHTTEKLPIYNEDGTVPLQNPMPTSQYGMTDVQVFLQDKDYTIKVEKWIGYGAMTIDDPNAEDWEEVRTFDNLYPAILVNSPDGVASIVEVSSMDALRDVQVGQGTDVNYAKLLGYYELGDMPPQYYKLISTSDPTIQDNGGSIIRPSHSTAYVWELIPQENIDVRVFGIFPSPTSGENISQTSNIHNCFNYANTQGKDVYFPQVYKNTAYYFVEGGTHSMWQKLVVDQGVHIVAKPLTTSTLRFGEIQYYGNQLFISSGSFGSLTVDCPKVKTSWKCNSWANWPGEVDTFEVDTLNSSFSFTDAKVVFVDLIQDKTLNFTDCLIESRAMMKNCTVNLTRCGEVSDKWLDTGCTVNLNGNLVYLQNFSSANVYIEWKNKQLDAMYGDLGEQTVSNITLLNNAVAENAQFSNVTVQGNVELHNVSGNIIPSGAGTVNINAVDCWMTITGASVVLAALQLRRGSVVGNVVQVLTTLYLDNVDLNITNLNIPGANATIENSRIRGTVSGTDMTITNNQIYANVNQTDNSGVITVNCTGNMFHNNARHNIYGTTANTVVNGIWASNGSSYDTMHWIRVDRTNLKIQDNDHHYSYMNNSEPYLQKYSGRNHPMHFPIYRANRDARDLYRTTSLPFVCINDSTYVVYVVPRNISWKCFSVGRGYLARSATIRGTWDFGILESDYSEHTVGNITIIYTWGAQATPVGYVPTVLDGQPIGYSTMVSRDGGGEANYDVSFEMANADHNPDTSPGGVFSNGITIGVLNRAPYDGWGNIARYPATPGQSVNLFVHIDNNFVAGATTPQGY